MFGRRRLISFLAAAFVVTGATPLIAQPASALTPKQIDDAIEWGTYGEPGPYLLHDAQRPGTTNAGVVGVVYTPFVRVALAARAARVAGRTFTAADVSRDLVAPVADIAFRWYCCVDTEHGSDRFDWNPTAPPFDYKIAMPGDPNPVLRGQLGGRVTASPAWISRDLSRLTRFGDLPYPDLVLIAGYDVNVLPTCPDFIIYRNGRRRRCRAQPTPG